MTTKPRTSLTTEECEALLESLAELTGGSPEYVLSDAPDPEDVTDRAWRKVFAGAEREPG